MAQRSGGGVVGEGVAPESGITANWEFLASVGDDPSMEVLIEACFPDSYGVITVVVGGTSRDPITVRMRTSTVLVVMGFLIGEHPDRGTRQMVPITSILAVV